MTAAIEFPGDVPAVRILLLNDELCRRYLEIDELLVAFQVSFFKAECARLESNLQLFSKWLDQTKTLATTIQKIVADFEADFGRNNWPKLNLSDSDFARRSAADPQRLGRLIALETAKSAVAEAGRAAARAIDKTPDEFDRLSQTVSDLAAHYHELQHEYRRELGAGDTDTKKD